MNTQATQTSSKAFAASSWSQSLGVTAVVFALTATVAAQPPMGGPRNMNAQTNSQDTQGPQTQLAQAKVDWVRQAMTTSGYDNAATQKAVLTFIQKQETERQTLRQQERQVATLLANDQATDEQISTQLTSFRNAVVQSNARVTQALTALDRSIQYSTQPRLELLLTVLGVVGQETASLGGVGAVFPDSPFATTG